MIEPITTDEPAASHDPPVDNPVLDDSNLKAMAAKFKANWPGQPEPGAKPATPPPAAEPPKAATEPPLKPSTETPGEIEDVKVDALTPITRDHFKRLAQARDSYKERAEKFKKEQETVTARAKQLEEELTKTKAALPPNLEEVQKALADSKRIADENKKLAEQLETISLERSPRFQNWWKAETGKHIKVAQAHVPPEHREKFAELLLAPASPDRNAALDEIVEALPPTSKRLATGALEAIESLKIQREDALTQGSERWKEMQAHEKAEATKAAQQREQRMTALQEEAVRRGKALSAFQATGDAAKDAEITQREAFVRAVVAGKLDEETMLNVPAAAVEMLHLRDNVIPQLKAEIEKQSQLIKQLQGSGPRGSDGKGPSTKQPEAKEGQSFADKVRELMTR